MALMHIDSFEHINEIPASVEEVFAVCRMSQHFEPAGKRSNGAAGATTPARAMILSSTQGAPWQAVHSSIVRSPEAATSAGQSVEPTISSHTAPVVASVVASVWVVASAATASASRSWVLAGMYHYGGRW